MRTRISRSWLLRLVLRELIHYINWAALTRIDRNDDVFDVQVPGLSYKLGFGTRVDWNYTTTPQVHASGEATSYARAMMLGGCSSHST